MQLHRARKDIEAAGAELVFIGQATPRHAAHFQRRYAPDMPILADEKRVSYKAVGAKRGGAAQLVGPSVILKGIAHAARSGVVQGRPVGDIAQLGATLLVMPDGSVPWSHISKDAADNPSVREIVDAVSAAA